MRRILFIIALSGLQCLNIPVFAQDVDPSTLIIPQQQKLLEQEKTNREIEEFKKWEEKAENDTSKPEETEVQIDENCFQIDEIKLEGNTALSQRTVRKIISNYQNTCISNKKIAEIITKFNALYVKKGYITTVGYVKEQNLKLGILTLSIVEGKVEDVTFAKENTTETTANKITKFFITPLKTNGVLNIKAIDQTTENLGYISSYQYKTNIDAGSKAGLSKVSIGGKKSFPVSPYVETDTLGQQYTGHSRYALGFKLDNPLKLGDSFNLKYTSTYNNERNGMYSRSFAGSWSMPIKWARIGINSSYSTYMTTIHGQNQSFQSSGNMMNNSFFLNGVVFRNKSVKTTLISTLNLMDSKNYIGDSLSPTQSKILANLELGITNNLYTPLGGFFHKLTYIKGLDAFGSKVDTANTTNHAQFDSVRFYQLYNIKTDKIFNGKVPFTYQNTIDSQYAWQDVYSQNQFVLGGFYSVRGFRDVNIYGSSGILTRNDVDFALSDYIKPTNKFTKIITNSGKGGLTLGAFFDIGTTSSHVKSNTTAAGTGAGNLSSGDNGVLSGAGYKIGYNSKYFQTSLVVAHSLTYPDYLSASVKQNDGRVVYLTVRGGW